MACGGSTSETVDINEVQTSAVNTAFASVNQTGTASIPTNTSAPVNTPVPTNTPKPTSTTNPNKLIPGMHLVGTEIQPGIYRGQTGIGLLNSCYWERLSGMTGNFSDLITNDNSEGQYYVEILPSDVAFKNDCAMEWLPQLPQPLTDFPTKIQPGTYLVNIEIKPGTYRGEAGSDITTSCYWERLSNVQGGFSGLLANDNAIGQFFVQVVESDFALNTSCELERVE
jgi:hypothetical protein